jgi:hypothetical protein
MDVIQEILSQFGVESVEEWEINAPHEVEVEACDPLTIEKVAPGRVSVGHYFTQNGDLMSDPEVRFDVEDGEWTPVAFTSHPAPPTYKHDKEGLKLNTFLQTWETNIRSQGFVEKAAKQAESTNPDAAEA